MPYLSASEVMIHEQACTFTFTVTFTWLVHGSNLAIIPSVTSPMTHIGDKRSRIKLRQKTFQHLSH